MRRCRDVGAGLERLGQFLCPRPRQPSARGDTAASRCRGDALLSEPMRRRRGLKRQPSLYLADGERWPRGRLRALTDEEKRTDEANDVLAVVRFVKSLAIRVEEKCKRETIYKVAKDANVNAQTVANFIDGETWGDVVVIFRLERGMKEALWSHGHVSASLRPRRRPRDYLIEGHQFLRRHTEEGRARCRALRPATRRQTSRSLRRTVAASGGRIRRRHQEGNH